MLARLMVFDKSIFIVLFFLLLPSVFAAGEARWHLPAWFMKSQGNLKTALEASQDKKGLIVYLGQAGCPFCHALMDRNWSATSPLTAYTRLHFNVVGFDIFSNETLTLPNGQQLSVYAYAKANHATFSPSLLFYQRDGEKVFLLRGYYPPYRMGAALRYVAEAFYQQETFADYEARAQFFPTFAEGDLNDLPLAMRPPFLLDRSHFKASRRLLVLWEEPNCHACDLLHTLLADLDLTALSKHFEVVQLNRFLETLLITPQGQRLTAKTWAQNLQVTASPTVMVFDEAGQEIKRFETIRDLYLLPDYLQP